MAEVINFVALLCPIDTKTGLTTVIQYCL